MGKTDISRNYVNELLIAFGLLTRLPLPQPDWSDTAVPAKAAWAYPLTGLVAAWLAGSVSWGLLALDLPAAFVAGVALAVLILSTGAMHEDGLADCADGFWGGWDKARRLKIMKDSSSGAYAVTALVLSLGLRWSALAAMFAQGAVFGPLIVAAVVSRAGMVWCMATLPNARPDGLSSTTGRPSMTAAGVASLWAMAACAGVFAASGVLILGVAAAAVVVWALIAMRKVEGQTGDVLGATQQICEVAVLGAMAALI